MQKAQPYDMQNLSSIKSESMDAIYEADRPDHEFNEFIDDSMILGLGEKPTAEQVAAAEEATGHDYSHRLED